MCRADRLFKLAKRSIPLAADNTPVEAIYEDDDLLAVAKPYGVTTAPKHRYTGTSLVNKIIGSRGFNPYVLHRLDMNTTGVVLFGKQKDVVPAIHAEFRYAFSYPFCARLPSIVIFTARQFFQHQCSLTSYQTGKRQHIKCILR